LAGHDYSKIANDQHIDETFANYRSNPESVSPDWRAFFQGFELGSGRAAASGDVEVDAVPQAAHSLVTAYRRMGHLVAHLAPISYKRPHISCSRSVNMGLQTPILIRLSGMGDS
jgi:2-oxoglutarate dehydrogenase complex dehydrogenase (E1) component-like enzyme